MCIYLFLQKPTVVLETSPADNKKQEETTTELSSSTEQIPPIPNDQVVLRLRQRREPVTLFGESDWQRYQRLHHLDERAPIEYIEGMDNEFAREVKEVEREEEKRGNGEDEDFLVTRKKQLEDSVDDLGVEDNKQDKNDKNKIKGDSILNLLKTMLSEWEQELNDRPDTDKRTAQGKVATATYKQCRKHIKPLFKLLREKVYFLHLSKLKRSWRF